ncbi:MAG: SH3 domain-containing protein [Bacillus sp. (in: Bacteria)]|nr:SH3 domain-containing protein [Bacillus sp. (in: firmicutes)]MCM1426728.1 SH3 domain-containing protein [Eubacterium sp.]
MLTIRKSKTRKPIKNLAVKALLTVMMSAGVLLSLPGMLQARAQEEKTAVGSSELTQMNQIMEATEETDARVLPDDESEILHTYHSGDTIFVTGQTAEGWYQVRYQDIVAYIPIERTAEIERDVEALDEEFAVEEMEGALVVEEVERQRTKAKSSKIWGAVIILLIVGIFATGIISTVKNGGKR